MKRSLLTICIALLLCGAVFLGYTSGLFGSLIAGIQGDNIQAGNSDNKNNTANSDKTNAPDNSENGNPEVTPPEEEEEPEWPTDIEVGSSATEVVADVITESNTLASIVELVSADGIISALVPEGALLEEGATALTFTVKEMEESGADISLSENESKLSIDVHIAGIASDNESIIKVFIKNLLPVGLNLGNYCLYHVENGETVLMTLLGDEEPVHNNFEYDPTTGDTTMYLKSFSEVALVSNIENAWNGDYDYSWFTAGAGSYTIANADQLAAFGKIVGGMPIGTDESGEYIYAYDYVDEDDGETYHWYTFEGETVTLIADVNIGDTASDNGLVFYPIGYWNNTGSYEKVSGGSVSSTVYSFEGTFDGNGNTIKNFYQNTWEMFGDYNSGYSGTPNHYQDGMGLFGYVYNGTIKNLTVANFSCDGEFTPAGCVAAYAAGNSVFENIAIVNCNPRVYNTGNGGIIGIAGDTSSANVPDNTITLKNITVDNTNKISALWGSWDVACGGLLGMFRGYSNLDMNNCHVAAQIDVNNDVCANYQYYWYRYSGMFIGSVRRNTKDANGYTVAYTENIKATDCTYTLGDWNEYWYCELVANSLASYTHDYQFSRLTKISNVSEIQDSEGNWNKAGNFVIPYNDNSGATCYHILEIKDEQGNITGYKQHNHGDSGYENFDLNGNGELDDIKEDRTCYFMPFNQIMNGDGYGVKAHYEFKGITEVDGDGNSYIKFTDNSKDLYAAGTPVSIGDLFAANGNVNISSPTVQVYVSPADESSTVGGTYSANVADWQQGTITFSGSGEAKVVITDYFYCTETVITVLVQKNLTISIGGKVFTATVGNWVYNTQKASATDTADSANACYYDVLVYDKNYTGSVVTNQYGVAIVLDEHGVLKEIYDGAFDAYWNSYKAVTGSDNTFDSSSFASKAWSELEEGELLLIFPNDGINGTDSPRAFAHSLRGNVTNNSDGTTTATNLYIGKTAVISGLTCDNVCELCKRCADDNCTDNSCKLKCAGNCAIVEINGNVSGVCNVVIDQTLNSIDKTFYNTYIVYSYEFKDSINVFTNSYGIAFVLNQYGEVVRIYDGADAKYYDENNTSGIQDSSFVSDYLSQAKESLGEGEYLLIAVNADQNIARSFVNNNKVIGAQVYISGVTFAEKN